MDGIPLESSRRDLSINITIWFTAATVVEHLFVEYQVLCEINFTSLCARVSFISNKYISKYFFSQCTANAKLLKDDNYNFFYDKENFLMIRFEL